MSLLNSLDISASGMTAQRLRMDVISNNLANVNTTRTASGGPYKRQVAVFGARIEKPSFAQILNDAVAETNKLKGVRVLGIANDPNPVKMVYNPDHPDANQDGYVAMPNIDTVKEMVDMISATRAYEANVTAANAAKSMAMKALEIGKV